MTTPETKATFTPDTAPHEASAAEPNPRLVAFRKLQALMNLDAVAVKAWVDEVRAERDANL